jgi:transposase
MLLGFKGIGPELAVILWAEGFFRHFDNRRQVEAYAGLPPTPGRADLPTASTASPKLVIHDCSQH